MDTANLSSAPPREFGPEAELGPATGPRALIAAIAPEPAVAVDTRADLPGVAGAALYPGEREFVARAVASRREEFATARSCARAAMVRLGAEPTAILQGVRGDPQWPHGLVGSITHCAGYRGAVLGRAGQVVTIGIDSEPNEPMPGGVFDAISLPRERAMVAELLAGDPGTCWDRLLFCAKEAVYKAWYPLAGCWLDFDDAAIAVNPAAGTFTARLRVAGPAVRGRTLTGFAGRWLARDGLLLTAIVLPEPTPVRIPPRRAGSRSAERIR